MNYYHRELGVRSYHFVKLVIFFFASSVNSEGIPGIANSLNAPMGASFNSGAYHVSSSLSGFSGNAASTYAYSVPPNEGGRKVFEKLCSSGETYNCVLMGLTAAQIAIMIAGYFKSNGTHDTSSCADGSCLGGWPSGLDDGGTSIIDPWTTDYNTLKDGSKLDEYMVNVDEKNKQSLADLKNKGFKFDPNGGPNGGPMITDPNGKTYSGADFASPQSMAAAGFSPEQIDSIQASSKKAEQAGQSELAKLAALIGQEGGGGGAAYKNKKYVGKEDSDGFDMNSYLKGLKGKAGKGNGRGVAGLTKQYGFDSIGVPGDNIFKMVERQYKSQKLQGKFIP